METTTEEAHVLDNMPKRYRKLLKEKSRVLTKLLKYEPNKHKDWEGALYRYWIESYNLRTHILAANLCLDIQLSQIIKS